MRGVYADSKDLSDVNNNNKKDGENDCSGGLNRDEKSKEQFDKLDIYILLRVMLVLLDESHSSPRCAG